MITELWVAMYSRIVDKGREVARGATSATTTSPTTVDGAMATNQTDAHS